MPGINDFLQFANGINANVLTQAEYVSRLDRTSGVVAGKASAQQANKTWRQSATINRVITQFILEQLPTRDCIDDGTTDTLVVNFRDAVRSTFSIPNTGVIPGTYGPTTTIAVQADGRLTSIVNTGLSPTGVTAGTYFGTTVTVATDGRITAISSVGYGQLAAANSWTQPNTFNDPAGAGIIIRGSTVNGAGLRLEGNGTVTPNKSIRVSSGTLQFVNHAYTAVIASLTDDGTFNAALDINGRDLHASRSISAVQDVSASGNVFGQALTATNGHITANNGKLRASQGAFGSGDLNCATVLNDFLRANNPGNDEWLYQRLPNGTIIQSYRGVNTVGFEFITFPVAFPNACMQVLVHEAAPQGWTLPGFFSPTVFGSQQLSAGSFALYVCRLQTSGGNWGYAAGISYRYIAIGY